MQPRAAFTLFEMMLVLALLVVLAALTAPSFRALYAEQSLEDAGDQVRGKWAAARARAVNDGVAYRFGVVWNKGHWRIAPDSDDYWTGAGEPSGDAAAARLVVQATLPNDIRFAPADDPSRPAGAAPAENVSVGEYARLVTFLPDGTVQCHLPDGAPAEELQVAFQGAGTNQALVLRLRALTGAVTTRWQSLAD